MATSDIETAVKAFAKDMTTLCEGLRKAHAGVANGDDTHGGAGGHAANGDKGGTVSFDLDRSAAAKVRTPEEQAEQVAAGRSWVCWGAHMTDKARHVVMKVDGKIGWDPKKTMGDDWPAFVKAWGAVMKRHALKNARGGDGWFDGDGFHLELADAKMSHDDPRAKACMLEYARLTRQANHKKNDKFEKSYEKLLKPYFAKYEKAAKK